MSSVVAFLDFFDSREKAALLWGTALLLFGTIKGGRAVVASAEEVGVALFKWKLLVLFGTAAAYCAAAVAFAAWLGIWHTSATKEMVYWFFTGGVVLVDYAVTRAKPSDAAFYAWLLRQAIRFTIIIEFLVNLYVFPFLVEVVVVPLVFFLLVAQMLAGRDESLAAARKPVDWMLVGIGFFLLGHLVLAAFADPSSLFTRESAETLLIAPALTVAFVPFLAAWAAIARWEQARLRKRFRPQYDGAA